MPPSTTVPDEPSTTDPDNTTAPNDTPATFVINASGFYITTPATTEDDTNTTDAATTEDDTNTTDAATTEDDVNTTDAATTAAPSPIGGESSVVTLAVGITVGVSGFVIFVLILVVLVFQAVVVFAYKRRRSPPTVNVLDHNQQHDEIEMMSIRVQETEMDGEEVITMASTEEELMNREEATESMTREEILMHDLLLTGENCA